MVATWAGAPSAAQAAPVSYGVIAQTRLQARDFERMAAGGVDLLRVMVSRPRSQSRFGDGDFGATDAIVAAAAERRIRILPYLVGASGRGGPGQLAAWSEFARAAAARYGRGGSFWATHPQLPAEPVKAWQILNEQNSREFFGSRPSPRAYARLLRAASTAIRGQDRAARIILGGMAELAGSAKARPGARYLRALYRVKGIEHHFDGVAVHPYAAHVSGVLRQVERFRAEMRRAHDRGAGLWVTEIGWSSARHGTPLSVGRRGQARRLAAALGYLSHHRGRLGVRSLVWFSWADSRQTICGWCRKSGLLAAGGAPKPAWRAFRRLAR